MSKPRSRRTDIIVAIIIVLSLLGLNVLIVQSVTNRSRRASCGNNLKKLLLSLHNYHDLHGWLPCGAQSRITPQTDQETSWGPSWFVGLLPHLREKELFVKLQEIERAAPGNDYVSEAMVAAIDGKKLKVLQCPSSALPDTQSLQGFSVAVPSYVGISGLKPVFPGPYGGTISHAGPLGMLGHDKLGNHWVDYKRLASSNRLAIGEIGHWYYNDRGNPCNPSLSFAGEEPKQLRSWIAGTDIYKLWDVYYPPAPNHVLNVVSIFHPINTNNRRGRGDDDPNWGTKGIGLCGLNNPLGSGHGRGAMGVFLDGHFEYLSENMDLDILRGKAQRLGPH